MIHDTWYMIHDTFPMNSSFPICFPAFQLVISGSPLPHRPDEGEVRRETVCLTVRRLRSADQVVVLFTYPGVGKCPILGILDITFKYLLEIISPILGWCSIGTFNDPCYPSSNVHGTGTTYGHGTPVSCRSLIISLDVIRDSCRLTIQSILAPECQKKPIWVCLKIGYIPNEIAIFHRDNDQQNHWVFRGFHNIFRHTHILSLDVSCGMANHGDTLQTVITKVGFSENVVKTPLYPMVLLIIIPMKNGYFIGNIPNIFRQTKV